MLAMLPAGRTAHAVAHYGHRIAAGQLGKAEGVLIFMAHQAGVGDLPMLSFRVLPPFSSSMALAAQLAAGGVDIPAQTPPHRGGDAVGLQPLLEGRNAAAGLEAGFPPRR